MIKRFLLLLLPILCRAQHQERTVAAYNIALGAVGAGIGGIINKPKATNWKHAFITGAWQGSIGGVVSYAGKRTVFLINKKQDFAYALPARILHAAGTSIIQNAANGGPFLKNWSFDYGPVRFDYSVGSPKVQTRFLPMFIVGMIEASKDARIDLAASVISGYGVFKSKQHYVVFNGRRFTGLAFMRAFVYADAPGADYLMAHELMHLLQYRDYQVINSFLNPVLKRPSLARFKKAGRYVYPDVPWFNYAYLGIGGTRSNEHYYRNFFEFEAERFATHAYVPVK